MNSLYKLTAQKIDPIIINIFLFNKFLSLIHPTRGSEIISINLAKKIYVPIKPIS